jgi:hypothetical protein
MWALILGLVVLGSCFAWFEDFGLILFVGSFTAGPAYIVLLLVQAALK